MGEKRPALKTKREILQWALEDARRRCEAMPYWKKSVLDNARKAEIAMGYVGVQKVRR